MPKGRKIIDASLVSVPTNRTKRDDNTQIIVMALSHTNAM